MTDENNRNEHGDESDKSQECVMCGESVDGPAASLRHSLAEHPRSEKLESVLSDVVVWSECSECGREFETNVSVGHDAKADKAMVVVDSYCDDCVDADPLRELMVRWVSPRDVLDREVIDDA